MIKTLIDIHHIGRADTNRNGQPLLNYLRKHGYAYMFMLNYIHFWDKLPIEERLLNLKDNIVLLDERHFKFTKRIKYTEYLNETKVFFEITVKLPIPDSLFTKIKNFILRKQQNISYIYYTSWLEESYFMIYKEPVDTIYQCNNEVA